MKKILVIQTAFIGDVVLATALVEKLHQYFPAAQIDFLLRKGNEALLAGHPFLGQVLIWDKRKNKLGNLWKMLSRIREERYDLVVNAQRFAATGILTAFSGAREKAGFDKNPFSFLFSRRVAHHVDNGQHEIERNQELISPMTDSHAAMPRLYPTAIDFAKIAPYQKGDYITASPASVWFTKQYPATKWIEFIRRLPPQTTIYLCGGPGDRPLCEEILRASGLAANLNLSGQLSFLQTAALMKGALMNYTNDSAPMHFASAMNAPVAAVFCSTVTSFGFGPLSDQKMIIETKEQLDCRPCGLHGYRACPQGHFKCAHEIRDEQLLEALS